VGIKYPRTLHHPTSPSVQSDDKVASDLSLFEGEEVVFTEKMDGENTSLYKDGFHARSLDSGSHPARNWLAAFHAERCYKIPTDWRICGENVFARHSVAYESLASYFLGFSVWRDDHTCLSWDETEVFLAQIDIVPVKVLWRGKYTPEVASIVSKNLDTDLSEGWVMRLASGFEAADFQRAVVKWVRPSHVQHKAEHWSKAPIVLNGLA